MTIERLYKYGCFNQYSEAVFSSAVAWFSSPRNLNDPFECRPNFTFKGSRDQILDLLIRGLRRQNRNMSEESLNAYATSIFLEGRHSRPETWDAIRGDMTKALEDEIGLYCLSSTPDNILMWSHYARDHTGYCLEFEATDYTPFFGAAQRVAYSDSYPEIDVFNKPYKEHVALAFLTKYSGWSYENEWRIIGHDVLLCQSKLGARRFAMNHCPL